MGRALHFTEKRDANRNEYWKGRDSLVAKLSNVEWHELTRAIRSRNPLAL